MNATSKFSVGSICCIAISSNLPDVDFPDLTDFADLPDFPDL